MRSINNDQNINRVYTKMSEDFHDENNAKLSKCVKSVAYFDEINTAEEEISDEEINVNDHMYASNTDNDEINEVSSSDANCQTAESEVTFLKEWLILHTDLIQQQNDDILDRDKQIYILRKENEMLKERINCIEKGIPFQTDKVCNRKVTENLEEITLEDMTQGPCEEDTKENIEIIEEQYCDNEDCSIEVINYQENHINLSDSESQIDNSVISNDNNYSVDDTEIELKNEFDPMKNLRMSIRRKRVTSNSSALSHIESPVIEERQTYRRFKKKKRRERQDILEINLSRAKQEHIFAWTDSSMLLSWISSPPHHWKMYVVNRVAYVQERVLIDAFEAHNTLLKLVKLVQAEVFESEINKLKANQLCSNPLRVTKDSQILTSSEPYVTQAHEVNLGISTVDPDLPECIATTLEVPRWRHKIYASCYTMEGTENLDDEVYNKRHMRLENDERRRKRWDVQRIREQRVIEKLKQRQERVGSGSKGDDSEPLQSLWPKVEDVKFLEVSEELPVSAFGNPVRKLLLE
ncbi:hypothetical protein NQ314_010896 [Rhamnusium bicolor]|uniref:PEHE domain-containing protein n=1 Tax=Rhamnusium bicolor TaxID=1586634 RepID=A0AAV8XNC2_9CUCU|nr:hypothetical protein NQ314_010896 [Rhamnusium bicolor]